LQTVLLARATERRKEIAIRLAIGASRRRLVRQLLTESVLLATCGGALGLVLAYWLVDAMTALRPPLDIPLSTEVHIDYRVLLFTAVVTVLMVCVFGLLPLCKQPTRPRAVVERRDLHQRYRRSGCAATRCLSSPLSLLLLICAGLVLRGLQRAQCSIPASCRNTRLRCLRSKLAGYDGRAAKSSKRNLLDRVRACRR